MEQDVHLVVLVCMHAHWRRALYVDFHGVICAEGKLGIRLVANLVRLFFAILLAAANFVLGDVLVLGLRRRIGEELPAFEVGRVLRNVIGNSVLSMGDVKAASDHGLAGRAAYVLTARQ